MWEDKGIEKEYDAVVFIGRVEPPHMGHMPILREAAKISKEVIILLGSRNRARSAKNPWRPDEREIMMNLAIDECVPELNGRFKIAYIADYTYNNQQWAKEVGIQVAKLLYSGKKPGGGFVSPLKVGIIGHKKDKTSFYLDLFPQWKTIEMPLFNCVSATNVRTSYFDRNIDFPSMMKDILPQSVINYLVGWKFTDKYRRVLEEYEYCENEKKKWKFAPYEVSFHTGDSVVIESGHILMIKRAGKLGHGLWALPGGFLDVKKNESLVECARRELEEETNLDVPPAMLTKLYSDAKIGIFDAFDRDLRGRIITSAFLIELPTRSCGLSKIRGGDDASHAEWIPLYELDKMSENGEIFADHSDIIFNLIGKI